MSVRSIGVRSVVALTLLAGGVTACGKSSSPVSPSLTSTASSAPAASSGATIKGLVTGASAGSSMLVSAAGTSVSSPVDAGNRFQLSGVPSGSVQLVFSGSGVNASVTVPGVVEKETTSITVSVNGNTATITGQDRDGSDSSAEAEGKASGVTGSCPTLNFSIGSRRVTTSAQTTFTGGACAAIKEGVEVDAKGTAQPDGSISAQSVKVDAGDSSGAEAEQEVEGPVTNVNAGSQTFQVSGKTVAVTAQTVIRHGSTMLAFGAIKVGVSVEVQGTLNASTGTLTASRIEIEGEDDSNGGSSDAIGGSITALVSGSCPARTFSVKGVMVATSSSTSYSGGACGDLKVGVSVQVEGSRQSSTSIQASKIAFGSRD